MSRTVFPVFFLRVPRHIEGGDMRLRPLRLLDGQVIRSGFRNSDILRSSGLAALISKSWISLWWWLKKTYFISYCIEVGSECIGFIGLYDLIHDRSAELSLVIFDNKNRRLGYGTGAFNLLAQNLKQYSPEIRVKVKADNYAAILFWAKLGFKELSDLDDMKLMSMDLTGDRELERCPRFTRSPDK